METHEPQWDRLAYYVSAHRARRGMSQKAVTKNGGPSDTTLGKIEAGKWRPQRGVDETLDKLDHGLGWEPGSASRVLAGGEPVYRVTRDDMLRRVPSFEEHRSGFTVVDTSKLARLLEAKAKPLHERTAEEQELVARSAEGRRRAEVAARRAVAEEPLVDLVDIGRILATEKNDDDVDAYVRKVESTVVGIMGVDRLTTALDARESERSIIRATRAGILDQFMDEVDRLRVAGIEGRELMRRVGAWLDAALTPNEAARSGVPGLQVSEVNEHSVKTETVLPDAVYEAGFNTAGETASPSEEGFFVATGGSSSAIPGLHVEWPKIDVVVDLPELPDREPVTEGLAPKIDVDVLEGWADAMDDLHAKLTSLQAVAKSESASEADPDLAVRAFLTAVDIYVFATRELVREMQAVDLYASEAQIRTGLVTFEYNIELAQLYLPTVEVIERSAPNKRLKVLPARSAEGLRALIDSLRAAHDAWIDAGLSSEHPADAMRALATAARTAPPGYRSPGRAARDAQDQVGEAGQLTGDDDGVH